MAVTIDGTVGVTSPDFIPSSSNIPTNGLFLPTTNALGFATNSTERLRLDASGNLGIGTSSPSGKLDVRGNVVNGAGTGNFLLQNSASNAASPTFSFNNYSDTGMFAPTTSTLAWSTGGTERARIDSSGNFGIGTSSPNALVDAYTSQGGSRIGATHGTGGSYPKASGISFGATSTSLTVNNNGSTISFVGGAGIYANNTAASNNPTDLVFWTTAGGSSAERARIDSSGNLLVGTTSLVDYGRVSINFASNGPNIGIGIKQTNSGSGTMLNFFSVSTQIGSITNTGSNTISFNTSSDQRLKENIIDAPSALSSVNAIKVRSFDWKSDSSHVDYGYIAQELLEVVPEAVSVPADPDEMMGVDFGKLTPRLVKAIQELTTRLEALENK